MQIKSTITNRAGQVLDVIYEDVDSLADLGDKKISAVHAYCFYNGKMVVVYDKKKDSWTPPGGKVEGVETVEEAVVREVHEEANMRVLSQRLIGYQEIAEPAGLRRQTRSVCVVEPFGPFVADPGGDITEVKFIDPEKYEDKYYDWGEVGVHILKRAMEVKEKMQSNL